MQHDKVMESGDADYALVEGEARRVAQDAVKAMKASRQQCWNAMSGQATWTGASGTIRVSQQAENNPQPSRYCNVSANNIMSSLCMQYLELTSTVFTHAFLCSWTHDRPKFGKKKVQKINNSRSPKEAEATEESGSSSLLARIRARNLLLTEDDSDATAGVYFKKKCVNCRFLNCAYSNSYLSTAPPTGVSVINKELLDDIRTYVSFGASVDGRATTEEIIGQFRDRLPAQSTALFKQLLMQICEFHRLPSGQGVWKLIPEFQW